MAELQWLGDLQQLLAARGGPDQPIRIFADEQAIAAALERWNRDTAQHQRALARIASMVPVFGAPYGEALVLTEFKGLTQKQLAERLGISLSGAKSRVQRGRDKLKEALLDCCQLEFDRRGQIIDCTPKDNDCCRNA